MAPITNPKWTAYKPTPRVPEYPSTFGILCGAVGEILKSFFSDNINQINLSSKISYNKISDAVDDNAFLKIYCGWNFERTAIDSIKQGKLIGQYVLATQFTRIRIPEMFRTWPPVFSKIYIK